ncbi:MAG: CocE/NonD family hydrolase [Gracilibacteraceae bacterium]|nr:CocE/NonD family hydrolase [Gracilibacteraceae bacterium]
MSEKSSMIQDASDEAMRQAHTTFVENSFEKVVVPKDFAGEKIDVVYRKQLISAGFRTAYYAPVVPGTHIVDGLIYERDVAALTRDGRKIYCDIYRPQNMTDIPIIIAWTYYGKRMQYGAAETPGLHQAMGVPKEAISPHTTFEAPDPTYWCSQGYAVAYVDNAGTGYSEGVNNAWTVANGQDGYDVIEWLAALKWCNGKIGMSGDSALTSVMWYIAAENPPHLAAIAPWEGQSDLYRSWMAPGGIPHLPFGNLIWGDWRGVTMTEDLVEMIKAYPLMNGYWEDHNAKVEQITTPAYISAGLGHPYHLRDTMLSYTKMQSKNKWLRIHRDFEWPDFYKPANCADLTRFFDRYLKGIHNAWEMTPRVRVEVTDAYEYDYVTNRPEGDWPIPRTAYTKFFLNAAEGALVKTPPTKEATVKYDPNTEEALFVCTFSEDTEITGHSALRLWIEIDKGSEADVFVQVRKLDANGSFVPVYVFGEPDPGFIGRLRASHRELDLAKSTEYLPVHPHTSEQPLRPGEIVPLDIEIWPNSRIWHKGEKLQISVTGRLIRDKNWFLPTAYETKNEGHHIIHTGGQYDSFFLAPVVPPKYTSGDYIYRG